MPRFRSIPIALTIAGSDSGGGAGIQADLKTFSALGVHGTSAITCLTAQNPTGVRAVQPAKPQMVVQQLEAVFAELTPRAAKTGMLYSTDIIRAVASFLSSRPRLPVVVDPVMVATSGSSLLRPRAIGALRNELLPCATLVTPNLPEAEILAEMRIETPEDLRAAARLISRRYGCAALVKGGHLSGGREAIDCYFDKGTELLLTAPFIRGVSTHGTGCVYSAAITGYLALGLKLPAAVERAKTTVTQAIAGSVRAGGHWVLNLSSGLSSLPRNPSV